MCGIAGVVDYTSKITVDIGAMIDFIVHRGPDSQNVFYGDNIAFGHARLRTMIRLQWLYLMVRFTIISL